MEDRDSRSEIEPNEKSESEIALKGTEESTTALNADRNESGNQTQAFHQDPMLAKVLDQYLDDLQNGRACSRASLIAEYPHFESELNECLEGIEMVAGLGVGADLAPKRMGDFEIVKPIGRGAMGVVYEAKQLSLKRTVALKMLRYSSAGLQASRRFEREAELVATLMHENIVPVYSYGEHENLHYFAMQLIEGPSLAAWHVLEESHRDCVRIASWGAQVARALAHAHQRDVIHRDVKPSNLLKEGDKIWLTDFGLARRFDDVRMSMTGTMLGTPNYMSPEQASPSRNPIDHRTDVYSLGATLFELLTGRCVFLADTPHAVLAQVLTEEAPPLRELVPDASRDLETILIKCLQKEPRDRYDTATELAEDLKAFAEGRSIRARRPSLIERAARWRRQNEKAFSWATTAAFAVVSLATIAALAWMGWRNSNQGRLSLHSDEGPIVGRLIDEDGNSSPLFTIPTQNPLKVDPGIYELEVWTNGRVGESCTLAVDRGVETSVDVKIPELGVFPEQTVRGMPFKVVVQEDGNSRHDFVLLGSEGIGRLDGRSGKELWFTEAAKLKLAETETQCAFTWSWEASKSVYHRDIPKVLEDFPDINQDGVGDVLVSCNHKAASLVLDGKSGVVLWHYVSKDSGHVSGFEGNYKDAQLVSDIDGDEVDDVLLLLYAKNRQRKDHRWATVVSGKTGAEIWRHDLIEKPHVNFSKPIPQSVQHRHGEFLIQNRNLDNNNGGFLFRNRSGSGHRTSGSVRPWAMVPESNASGDVQTGWLVYGKQLLHLGLENGSSTEANGSQPFDLGFYPCLQPQMVNLNGVDHLLFSEQAVFADENSRINGECRHVLWSTKTFSEVWEYTASADPNWTSRGVDWPKLVDITGDGVPEILIADGADLGARVFLDATCQGSLQALDASTGKPIWEPDDLAKIRTQDRQVFNFVVGPDADSDSLDDIYVVSPMIIQAQVWDLSVFIDVLSSKSGKRIRTVEAKMPFVGRVNSAVNLGTPFFWGTAPDGSPQIVISTLDLGKSNSTAVVSTESGKIVFSGAQLQLMAEADGDGDGRLDLFMHRSRDSSNAFESGQFVSIKLTAPQRLRMAGANYRVVHDLDGDGKQDLLTDSYSNANSYQRAVSSRTGKPIWNFNFPNMPGRLRSIEEDIDGDGVDDFFGVERGGSGGIARASAFLVSGGTGVELWRFDCQGERAWANMIGSFSVRCADVDSDGELEILLLHRASFDAPRGNPPVPVAPGVQIVLVCLDAKRGEQKWISVMSPDGVPPNAFGNDLSACPMSIQKNPESNGTIIVLPGFIRGVSGVHCSAMHGVDGLSGKVLWDSPFTNVEQGKLNLWRFHVSENTLKNHVGSGQTIVRTEPNTVDHAFSVKWTDYATGREVSSYNGNGILSFRVGEVQPQWSVELGTPFDISDGQNIYTGVVVNAYRFNGLKLLVLDSSTPEAKVVREIMIPTKNSWNRFGQVKIADCDSDGQVDAICHFDNKLVAYDLLSGMEILQRELPAERHSLLRVDKQNRLHFLSDGADGLRLKLIEVSNFETQWDIVLPNRVAKNFDIAVVGGNLEGNDQLIPEFFFAGNDQVIAAPTRRDYVGDDLEVLAAFSSAKPPTTDLFSPDPRLILPTPWKYNAMARWNEEGLVWSWLSRLVVVLGVFVFPIFYLRFWSRNGVISLKMFLLLPLLFAVPYAVLTQPLDPRLNLAFEYGLNFGQMFNVFLHSLVIIPALISLTYGSLLFRQSRWNRLAIYLLITLLVSVLVGGGMIWKQFSRLPEGCRYDYWDPSTLVLIPYGMSIVGAILIFTWSINQCRIALGWFRRKKVALSGAVG